MKSIRYLSFLTRFVNQVAKVNDESLKELVEEAKKSIYDAQIETPMFYSIEEIKESLLVSLARHKLQLSDEERKAIFKSFLKTISDQTKSLPPVGTKCLVLYMDNRNVLTSGIFFVTKIDGRRKFENVENFISYNTIP